MGDGGAYGLLGALAECGTHPSAHWHGRIFLSALVGQNIGASPPRSRTDALALLRKADKVLARTEPKRRGGWSVTIAPRAIPIAELIEGPVEVPLAEFFAGARDA